MKSSHCSTARAALVGLLTAQLVVVACAHGTGSLLDKTRNGKIADAAELSAAMQDDPRNATLLALEQSFSLLRSGLPSVERERDAKALLETAHASFEDLSDPANMNTAFSADDDKPYRGRPHERVLTTTMLALTDMAQGRCDMAIPTLRSAEFLDARWQPFPFGTDTPLVYALLLRCAHQTKAAPADVERARTGLLLATRLKLALDPALDLLHRAQFALPRGESIATRLGAILFEQALPAVLINSPQAQSSEELIRAAASEAQRYVETLEQVFEDDNVLALFARVERLAPGYANVEMLKKQATTILLPELMRIDAAMRSLVANASDAEHPAQRLTQALQQAQTLAQEVEAAVTQERVLLRFAGKGPSVEREGQYDEVAVIKASADGTSRAEIRQQQVTLDALGCGFHNAADGAMIAVLCNNSDNTEPTPNADYLGVELWSSSYQATSVVGRRFERVLKGRAQFKSGAENVSVVAAWTAWFLFQMGMEVLEGCDSGGEVCLTVALIILAIAVLSIGVAGTVWLVGAAVNPSADARYVHNLFESGQLLLPAAAASLPNTVGAEATP